MSRREKIIDEVARAAGGAVGLISSAHQETIDIIKSKIDAKIHDLDLVTREDFELLEGMVIKLREEQDLLKKRIETLEKKG